MPPNDSQGLKRENPNNESHVLDLFTGIRIHVGSRLHDRGRKIRNYTLFFRPDGILPTNGFIREKAELISIRKTTQLIK
jgi:hypothetical protein